jgi:hypothetical protein
LSNSHGAASAATTVNGPWRLPSSLARYCTPARRASGRPSLRQSLTRRIVDPSFSTFQKKLFADRKISRPPRSRKRSTTSYA